MSLGRKFLGEESSTKNFVLSDFLILIFFFSYLCTVYLNMYTMYFNIRASVEVALASAV